MNIRYPIYEGVYRILTEKAADFLQKNRRKLKLEEDDIECFRQHSQTQGRNTNYLVQSCPYNPVRARDLE